MLSRIYEGSVNHARKAPEHGFSYPHWAFMIHLDELDMIARLSPLVSLERLNLLSFRDNDYLPQDNNLCLAERIRGLLKERTGSEFQGDIYLLTTLRQLGYCMNPLSLYFCKDISGSSHVIAEVHNTPWGEVHCYVLGRDQNEHSVNNWRRHRLKKVFHVSPFIDMDIDYDWRFREPVAHRPLLVRHHPPLACRKDLVPLPEWTVRHSSRNGHFHQTWRVPDRTQFRKR